MIEARLQALILAQVPLRMPDCRIWRTGLSYGKTDALPRGWPDITGVFRHAGIGVALFVEVKSPKGRSTPEQAAFGCWFEALGACHVVARSLEDVLMGIASWKERHTK